MPSDPIVLPPRPKAERTRPRSVAFADLDATQRDAVVAPGGRPLLVLGEAGHGKTTVAVHRLAHLWHASPRELRAAFIVPSEGLARLVQRQLRELGVDLEVSTYDRWARHQARKAFRDLPRRESEITPVIVSRLKRDPALRVALDELASRAPGRIDDDADARPSRSRAHARRADLQHLFGDRLLLERVVRESSALPPRAVDETLEHARIQFTRRTEHEWRHVTDKERLVAVDRMSLDVGTATANATTVDVEDYAVLFELDRLRAEHLGRAPTPPPDFDVIVLDETQELAPLELALIGRSLAPGGSLVVAGDADQQTDETTAFDDWQAVMSALGARDHETVRLDVGYRCPPAVAALARFVIGRAGWSVEAKDIALRREDEERELGRALGRAIDVLLEEDPRASVLVACRSPKTARRFADRIRAETPARLVFDGRFLPRGAQITTVDETKGLEFDYVVVPDATASDYPDDPASRRALYVAITRARYHLLLASAGEPTSMLAPERSKRLPLPGQHTGD